MRILIAEDDRSVAGFLKKGLKEEHYAVDVCYDGEEALFQAQVNEYDLIILDVMLPKKNGFAVCQEIRQEGNLTPILMLTVRDQLEDKVKGLQVGADDYLTKPFAFKELLARIQALLRRTQDYKTQTLKVGDLEIDPVARKVTRENKTITLTGKEYALLEYLMRNKGRIVTQTMIIDHVWDMNYDGLSNVVNVYINHLREKIDKGFSKKYIHTIRGVGYKIDENEDV
ncbi:MAG: response regulator [Candidatus Aminicenantes bacterium]|nr:response regulator [Candidatus Aminicenantes bacterium]NIM79409.1 response regulator [Candidatus Aminicenantes bacterium]NIN18691.1 response regulator [Candidatus Aminicenantes bacterium]NIN42588.1 response regulator [Candidatus Aminicenantes bacterium]NIN85354.1 response regulator [Candidatus Aminicenantes bacterium]